MSEVKMHKHEFHLNTDVFIGTGTDGPHGDFFMYCPDCDEHPTISDIEGAVNGYAALRAKLEALQKYLFAKGSIEAHRQWGWNGELPMRYGYCYECGAYFADGHRDGCVLAALAAGEVKP
jgi:hypothetical protein